MATSIDKAFVEEYYAICARQVAYVLNLTNDEWSRVEPTLVHAMSLLSTNTLVRLHNDFDGRISRETN